MNVQENLVRKRPILVVTALRNELNDTSAPDGVEIVFAGVGKINAALAAAEALLSERRALVVNYGTCGKISKGLHGLVEVSRVIQRDMMAMPLAPRGVTPFCEDSLNDHILEIRPLGLGLRHRRQLRDVRRSVAQREQGRRGRYGAFCYR